MSFEISTAGMQKLLNMCDQYSNDHYLIYSSKNSMCMCFTPKSCKSYECKLSLNQECLSYVMLVSHCGKYMANGLTNAVRYEFVMIANDRQTFVAVRKHSR